MPDPLDLFYAYAPEDEKLRRQLEKHLAMLRREGLIRQWHERDISAGSLWQEEIDAHVKAARIILLLVSPDFLASDYCFGVEMQEAIRRQVAGEAKVIPVLLRACDWENAPFKGLQVLPKERKPVTMWANRDAAFADIARGIREAVYEILNPLAIAPQLDGTSRKTGKVPGGRNMAGTPTTLHTAAVKKAIDRYYKHLDEFKGKADYELAVRSAFQNLLAETARMVGWTLIPEQTLEGGIRPDGVLRDDYSLMRGFWEAKGPKSDLEKEIKKKIADGYPLTNTVFENTRRAVLYQGKKRLPYEYDLSKPNDVSDLLQQFLTYTEPDIEHFETAVSEFKERIPELAQALLAIIEKEHAQNRKFSKAFDEFAILCRASLDPKIGTDVINEMLIQHLLTERLFNTIFGNADFVKRNVIAAEIEKVIDALTSRYFNRHDFLKALDRFYVAIEATAKGIENWSERQHFLNTVYERFFQGYSVKRADTYGIVYTPQEIVDFMCASVDEVLKREFNLSIAQPGVQIIDPCVGTGSYIVNLLHRIPTHQLKHKYRNDLFCNEIMLLAYYIASLNIEHEYYSRVGEYEPFEGICFTDTLELAESKQLSMFVEKNTDRIEREKNAQIMVVIGNPPYNAKQENANDNNQNRRYSVVDKRIQETYTKDSKASSKIALSDAYVKFFRWATDRLQGRDGIVCFISNNSFIDQIAFDGMRKHLLQDFNCIYHLDLHGNVRKNPKISGTSHNVFGIQIGVGITIAVRASSLSERKVFYYRVPENWRKEEKLNFISEKVSINGIDWKQIEPVESQIWLTEGIHSDFTSYLAIGRRDAKSDRSFDVNTIFKNYGRGVATARDNWAYDFSVSSLKAKINRFIETYNNEVDRWKRRGSSSIEIDSFITYDDTKIKWSEGLKLDLMRGQYAEFAEHKIVKSMYRPFSKRWLFFDRILNERVYQFPSFFPNTKTNIENYVIGMNGVGGIKPFHCFVTDCIVDLNFYSDPVQCFPYYTYNEDGSNRRENITDWALGQFQAKYGPEVTKWDIFHYVYALLHHPQYRERYAENLKRDLPHIPLLHRREAFCECVRIGRRLMELHLGYEQAQEYPVEWVVKDIEGKSLWRVEKMKLTPDKTALVVNESLTLQGIPPECFFYRLGNRSALEWVVDQYQVSEDKRSGIVSDPNNLDDEEYIVRLACRVITVSVETVKLVGELSGAVGMEDWM